VVAPSPVRPVEEPLATVRGPAHLAQATLAVIRGSFGISNVVECSFGVWKISGGSFLPEGEAKMIVAATMCLSVRTIMWIKILENLIRMRIMSPLYLGGTESILVRTLAIHQLHCLMIGIWINSMMTLLEHFFFLGHHDYICLYYMMIYDFVLYHHLA
jgi:hypothetical protein